MCRHWSIHLVYGTTLVGHPTLWRAHGHRIPLILRRPWHFIRLILRPSRHFVRLVLRAALHLIHWIYIPFVRRYFIWASRIVQLLIFRRYRRRHLGDGMVAKSLVAWGFVHTFLRLKWRCRHLSVLVKFNVEFRIWIGTAAASSCGEWGRLAASSPVDQYRYDSDGYDRYTSSNASYDDTNFHTSRGFWSAAISC